MEIRVETALGPSGYREPEAFFIGRRRLGVVNVLDRWLTEEYGYYKVVADDGAVYILRFDDPSGAWEMTLFRGPGQPV